MPDQFELPTWSECLEREFSNTATPLEQFILDNEPAGQQDQRWREQLTKAIQFTIEQKDPKTP
jgi:hypothetical protein